MPTFVPDSRRIWNLGDIKVPYFIIAIFCMTDKAKIEKLVSEYIQGTELFLVAVRMSATGKITILADRKDGITIEECAGISRFLEKNLDRETDDFELMVSSPGLDMPFLVLEQYYKSEGKRIEVVDTTGEKITGILKNVGPGGFEIETEEKKKSAKGKAVEKKDISFNYEQVKSAREVLTFK
jgi:ribosome maturation factor RimP